MTIKQRPTIPEAEYQLRLASLRAHLKANNVVGALLLCPADISWLSGFMPSIIAPNMAFCGVYIPMQGDICFVAMPGYANHIRESAWGEVVTVSSPQIAIETLLEMVGRSGFVGGELSMGLHRAATAAEIYQLETVIGAERLIDVSASIWAARMVKSPWEIERYRRLGKITAAGFQVGLEAIAEGVTEVEIARVMRETFFALGADAGPSTGQIMVRSGRDRYPVYCGSPTDRRVGRDEQVMLAGGPSLFGYHIDIHRFANVGPVQALEQTLYSQSRAGLEAAIQAVRPGVTTGKIFAAALQAMTSQGADENAQWQVLGHGIGLENYEFPMIRDGGADELQEGMVLALEVPAYDLPEFRVMGAFLEECVVVTSEGCDVLTGGVPLDLHISI